MLLLEEDVPEVDHKTALIEEKHRLQRLFRIREIQRLEARKRTLKKFLIQRYEINILSGHLHELKADEANVICRQNAIKDTHCKNSLAHLLDVQAKHRKDIEELELQRKTLKNQIEEAYRLLCAKRNEYSRAVRKKKPTIPMQKQVTMFECRLEHERQTYGLVLYRNYKLRYEIQHLLIVRSTYEQQYRKCHSLFKESIKIMKEHLNTTNIAYHSRGEFRAKISLLRDRYEGDMAKLYANQQLLHRLIEKEAISDTISATKEKYREDAKALALQAMINEGITGLEEQVQKSQTIFNEITQTSGLQDIEAIREEFASIEDENFTLFTYVNKVHQETEALELHVSDLRAKIRGIENNLTVDQKQYRKEIRSAQNKLEGILEEVGNLRDDQEDFKSELEAVLGIMQKLFNLCGCTDAYVLNALRTGNLDNDIAAEVIELLEKYVVDLLLVFSYRRLRELDQEPGTTEDADTISLLSSPPSFHIASKDPRHLDSINPKTMKRLEITNDFLSYSDLQSVALEAVGSSTESVRSSGSSATN